MMHFEFEVKITENRFTPEMDAYAQSHGLASRFSSLGVGSVFKAVADIDLDEQNLTEANYSDPNAGNNPFSWSATDELGEFANGWDSVTFLSKTNGILDFYGEGWTDYGFGFRLDTSNWSGTFGIYGGEYYDWAASLTGELTAVNVEGYRPVQVPEGVNTLYLLAPLFLFGILLARGAGLRPDRESRIEDR